MRKLRFLAACCAAPALAQGVVLPQPLDIAAAVAAASSATSAANAASATAKAALNAIPPACTSVPAMDTTNGSIGSASICTPAADNTRPANVQIATAVGGGGIVTASDGTFTGAWPRTWLSAPSYAHAEIYGTTTPFICMVVSATAASVSGKCSQVVTTALPGTLLALGATIVNPLSAAPAGLTVRVVGRQ